MKPLLASIARNSSSPKHQEKYLNEIFVSITDNKTLEEKIGEIFPFLTDNDRLLRGAAMTALSFINDRFQVAAVNNAIFEMAVTKLGDSATLRYAMKIIKPHIDTCDSDKLVEIMNGLFSGDLRSNLVADRTEAYLLLDSLLDHEIKIPPTKEMMDKFNKFCGYEQDPRCLTAIFKLFPKFVHRVVIDDLPADARNVLFDVISVFYPITQYKNLASSLSEALSSVPEFTNELMQLVSSKLTNALSDTRCSVFESLPTLIGKTKAPVDLVSDVVVSFAKSLSDYFSNGSTDTPSIVVDDAVHALIDFVRVNEESHMKLKQAAIQNWIPEIINSKDVSVLRAYSIVTWGLNTVLEFTSTAMVPLCCVADDSYKNGDSAKLQCILASILEFLKFHEKTGDEIKDLSIIVGVCLKVLASDNYQKNAIISALAVLRELSNKSFLPLKEELVPLALKNAKIQEFSAQLFCSLAYQTQYYDEITTKLKIPITAAINGESMPAPFESKKEIIEFASRLCIDDFYSRDFLPAFAHAGNTKDLLRCILPKREIDEETSLAIFSAISSLESDEKDSVLAVALRAPEGTLKKAIPMFPGISHYLMFAAKPSDLPEHPLLDSEIARFAYGAKTTHYIEGFVPPATALAFRGEITKDFVAKDIPTLLEMEDFFDGATGGNFNKFDLLEQLFIYNPDYKMLLWKPFYKSLDNEPYCLCKLCLLCPPDFFLSSIDRYIPMFPTFLKTDRKDALNLLIFTLMNLEENRKSLILFIGQMSGIIPALLDILSSKDAHERLDTVKTLYLICKSIPHAACEPHKHSVMKKLAITLDDPKREIRSEAAQTRIAWMKVKL